MNYAVKMKDVIFSDIRKLKKANFDSLLSIRYPVAKKIIIFLITHIQLTSCKMFMLHIERVKHNFDKKK